MGLHLNFPHLHVNIHAIPVGDHGQDQHAEGRQSLFQHSKRSSGRHANSTTASVRTSSGSLRSVIDWGTPEVSPCRQRGSSERRNKRAGGHSPASLLQTTA